MAVRKSPRNREIREIALAALLHDIGKVYQRTGAPLTVEDRRLEDHCCPSYNQRRTHQHVLWTDRFFRENLPSLGKIAGLATYHHRPEMHPSDTRSAKIVMLADWLASGERRGKEEEDPGDPSADPLVNIFSCVTDPEIGRESADRDTFWPLEPLSPRLTGQWPTRDKPEVNYEQLWKAFTSELRQLFPSPGGIPDLGDSTFQTLLSLLEKYTLFVPAAAYRDMPDISLYHHLKTASAIAACLAHRGLDEPHLDDVRSALSRAVGDPDVSNRTAALLVVGDISGIQDFIYSVTSAKALKGLRGRSLYLQLISDYVAKSLLQRFGLPPVNLILSAGGHFYLLLPPGKEIEEGLVKFKEDVSGYLLKHHSGRLGLSLCWVGLSYSDFLRSNFGNVWLSLGNQMAQEKRRRFATALSNVLAPHDAGGKAPACSVCGMELKPTEGDPCDLCNSFVDLARDLVRASCLIEKPAVQGKQTLKGWQDLIHDLGFSLEFRRSRERDGILINEVDLVDLSQPGQPNSIGFKFVSRVTPTTDDGSVLGLNELAEKGEGIRTWGVLRGDVDRLGQVFEKGLGENKTLSRLSTLSYLLSLFFGAHIDSILSEEEFRDRCSAVYSGGDDLFILAHWSVVPSLASRIHDDFEDLTGGRLTLSAGIFIAPSPHFPVYRAAEESGEALERAKKQGGNRVTFFDRPLEWQDLKKLSSVKDMLVDLLENGAPRALLNILYAIYKLRDSPDVHTVFPIWRLLYALKRMEERHKHLKQGLSRLRNEIVQGETLIADLDIAVRWAEYLTRKEAEE